MMAILSLTFILSVHFLSFKITSYSLKLINTIRCYKWNTAGNYCFLYFFAVFTYFLKTILPQSPPFDVLHHKLAVSRYIFSAQVNSNSRPRKNSLVFMEKKLEDSFFHRDTYMKVKHHCYRWSWCVLTTELGRENSDFLPNLISHSKKIGVDLCFSCHVFVSSRLRVCDIASLKRQMWMQHKRPWNCAKLLG